MLVHDQTPSISESMQLQDNFDYILLLEVSCTVRDVHDSIFQQSVKTVCPQWDSTLGN